MMLKLIVFCAVIGIVFAISADQFPIQIQLPITFYDYEYYSNQITNRINNQNTDYNKELVKDMKEDSNELQHCLCDFNICSQGTRKSKGYCPNHVHADALTGYIAEQLNANGRPYLDPQKQNSNNKSYLAPHMWYVDNKYNQIVHKNITLDRKGVKSSGVPMYQFIAESNFFMIDGNGWDAPSKNPTYTSTHNYVFGTHFHAKINYANDANTLEISSDDDSWLFIDKKLAIDYGGTRAPAKKPFTIKNSAFVQGNVYDVDFFHADRCATQASFTIFGPLTCDMATGGDKVDTDKDGVPDCADGCYKNKYKVSETKSGCTCDDMSPKCFDCSKITSEKLCEEIENEKFVQNGVTYQYNCDWCAKAGANGQCKNKGTCACEELPNDKCGKGNYPQCKSCISTQNSSTITCNKPEMCSCDSFTTLEDCASAKNQYFSCIWCGNKCIDSKKESCPGCGTYNIAKTCLSVFDKRDKTISHSTSDSACVWCTNGKREQGKCVKGETECNCNDQALLTSHSNADICGDIKDTNGNEMVNQKEGIGYFKKLSDYESGNNRFDHYCDWCVVDSSNQGTCIHKNEKCNICHLYDNNEEDCLHAKGCSFCGNSCISADEDCDECEKFNESQSLCENAYIQPYSLNGDKPSKCVYCMQGQCVSNKDVCKTCSLINNNSAQFKNDFFTIGAEMSNCTKISKMEPAADAEDHQAKLEELKSACVDNKYCIYKEANAVGSKCISQCEEEKSEHDCNTLKFCKWSNAGIGQCVIKSDSDIQNDLLDAIRELRTECLSQIANKCNFCGFLNFYYEYVSVTTDGDDKRIERTYSYPNLCVAYDAEDNDNKCIACSDLVSEYSELSDSQAKALPDGKYRIIHRLKGQTPQDNCHSLAIEYNSESADEAKQFSGYQQCGYCEGTGNCATLEDPIEYFNVTDENRADYLFYYKNCDIDCHLYKEDKYCSKSHLNCSWCKYPDGSANCTRDYEECPACKEYKSAYRCSDAGCRWCDLSSNCVTGNRDCPELPAIVGIAAGVIAAIIIAAVVGVALSAFASKKIYDAINEARETSMDSATSNPLYTEAADGGSNPVFEAAE